MIQLSKAYFVRQLKEVIEFHERTVTPRKAGFAPSRRLRTLADSMQSAIDAKLAPMTQSFTPKRGREHAVRVHDGRNLERCQKALIALADGWDNNNLPDELKKFRTKKDVLRVVETRCDTSGGYYSYRELHGEFRDNSPTDIMLREFCGIVASKEDAEADKLQALLDKLRMNPHEGFFPTPPAVIQMILDEVGDKLFPGAVVLEPSAGIGRIVEAVIEKQPICTVFSVENHPVCCEVLRMKGFADEDAGRYLIPGDFLHTSLSPFYDVILMNPPFERRQDIAHVQHAYSQLNDGGRLVAIVSAGSAKDWDFLCWIIANNGATTAIDGKAFSSVDSFRRTGVSCYMVTLDKE